MVVSIRSDVHDLRETRQALQGVDICLRELLDRIVALEGGNLDPPQAALGDFDVKFQGFMRASSGRVHGRLYDVSADEPVLGTEISTDSTSLVLVTSATVTLTLGNEYRAQFGILGGDGGLVVGAHVVTA